MNERIKELLEQAMVLVPASEGSFSYWHFDKEKFAELILRDVHQYVDGLDTAQIISNGILRRYGMSE